MSRLGIALLVALAGVPAGAHDGFEGLKQGKVECCGGHDCRTIPDDWIQHDAKGYTVVVPAGAWDKFPTEYFPDGITLEWEGEPGFSPDGRTIACATAWFGSGAVGVNVPPMGRLRCLFVGGTT